MEFFQGFAWAMPKAFAAPIYLCRFEEGDTFYDKIEGYESWDIARDVLNNSIQVTYPKANKGVTLKQQSLIFNENWESEVRVRMYDFQTNEERTLRSTQGRLFSALWRGELSFLEDDITPKPPMLINEVRKAFSNSLAALIPRVDLFTHNFIIWHDEVNQVFSDKVRRIESSLGEMFEFSVVDYSPDNLSLENSHMVAPTIYFKCFEIKSDDFSAIYDCLKNTLYRPLKNKKTKVDRFKLSMHGVLK